MGRIATGLTLLLCAAGCKVSSVEPMPDLIPSFGMLLQTEVIPLGLRVQLRRYHLMKARIGNEFYPINVLTAEPTEELVSRLFVTKGLTWEFLDYAEMPRADVYRAIELSPSGTRLLFQRPDVSAGEAETPRRNTPDRRSYRAVVCDLGTGGKFVLDEYAEVYSAGACSYWRPDSAAAAFTTTTVEGDCQRRELVIVDLSGRTLLDADAMPELAGLEYIRYSPDGQHVAALRPAEPSTGGRGGGTIVLVDPQARTVTEAGQVSSLTASQNLFRFDRLVKWDRKGNVSVKS